MSRDPFVDPVREAVARYFQRFPDSDFATHLDATAHALFKHVERMLVQADIALQDEGLGHDARRRVISAALYGSVDAEAAAQRLHESRQHYNRLEEGL